MIWRPALHTARHMTRGQRPESVFSSLSLMEWFIHHSASNSARFILARSILALVLVFKSKWLGIPCVFSVTLGMKGKARWKMKLRKGEENNRKSIVFILFHINKYVCPTPAPQSATAMVYDAHSASFHFTNLFSRTISCVSKVFMCVLSSFR